MIIVKEHPTFYQVLQDDEVRGNYGSLTKAREEAERLAEGQEIRYIFLSKNDPMRDI